MAVKSPFFLRVIVATFLLVSYSTAHAREHMEAKDLNRNNIEPTIGPGLKDEKWFVGIIGGYNGPGYGVGYGGIGGGLQPGIGGGLQQPGIGGRYGPLGYGAGPGFPRGFNGQGFPGGFNGQGFPGGIGIPRY